jgi:hypothetical protein
MCACSETSRPRIASQISVFTCSTAFSTPLPKKRWASPSRSSIASRDPVDAPRRHRRPPHRPRFHQHVRLHRGVAARIEDFAGEDFDDGGHSAGSGLECPQFSDTSPQPRAHSLFANASASFLRRPVAIFHLSVRLRRVTQARALAHVHLARLAGPERSAAGLHIALFWNSRRRPRRPCLPRIVAAERSRNSALADTALPSLKPW